MLFPNIFKQMYNIDMENNKRIIEDNELLREEKNKEISSFFAKVYAWMFLGLIFSGISAQYIVDQFILKEPFNRIKSSYSQSWAIFGSTVIPAAFLILFILKESVIKKNIKNVSYLFLFFLFFLYSFIMGITLPSLIMIIIAPFILLLFNINFHSGISFIKYTIIFLQIIEKLFLIPSLMFGITSIYAYLFKARLTNLKYTLMMGILGMTIASIYNFFTFRGEWVYYIITYLSVIFFTGIAGHNIQRLDNLNIRGNRGTLEDLKESLLGALLLYAKFSDIIIKSALNSVKRKR